MKRLLIASAVVALITGCSSTAVKKDEPIASPTPAVTKDQTVAAAGKVEAPMTIDVPSWYIKAPASTDVLTVIAIYLSFPLVAALVHPQLSAPPLATATSVCQAPANTDAPTVFAMSRTFSSEAINTATRLTKLSAYIYQLFAAV